MPIAPEMQQHQRPGDAWNAAWALVSGEVPPGTRVDITDRGAHPPRLASTLRRADSRTLTWQDNTNGHSEGTYGLDPLHGPQEYLAALESTTGIARDEREIRRMTTILETMRTNLAQRGQCGAALNEFLQ
jgi:hypothetical protein